MEFASRLVVQPSTRHLNACLKLTLPKHPRSFSLHQKHLPRNIRRLEAEPESKASKEKEDEYEYGDLDLDPKFMGELMPVDADDSMYESDRFEGEEWEWVGVVMRNFLPVAVVLVVLVGGLAAVSYNQGSTVFVTPASEDAPGKVYVPSENTADE